jgi:O-succinylbenzoate synthase
MEQKVKVKKIEIYRINLPLTHPFKVSFGTVADRDIIVVKLIDDSGEYGLGEAPTLTWPVYKPDFPETVISVVEKVVFPTLKDKEFETAAGLDGALSFIKGHEFAKSAVSTAAYDLYGKLEKKNILEILGAKERPLVRSRTVSLHDNIEAAVKQGQEFADEGLSWIKLKTKPGYDVEYVKALRENFADAKLMIDANASYQLNNETINIYKEIDKYDLFAIEQPLQWNDIVQHAKLQKEIETPIALDESVDSLYHAKTAFEIDACRMINIKIPRVGGLTEAKRIHDYAVSNNIPVWVGGMIETHIGTYANLAFACLKGCEYPVDFMGVPKLIVGFEDYYNTLPYEIKGEYVYPKLEGYGMCMDIDEDKYFSKTVDKITCE